MAVDDATGEEVETGDNRPPVYREGGRWIIRASAFGRCTLELARHAAGMQGTPPPQAVRDAWKFGRENEQVVIDRLDSLTPWRVLGEAELKRYGKLHPKSRQLELELDVAGKTTIRCHPDGVVEHRETGERRVLEVKIMARGSDPEKWEMYRWQESVESAVTGGLGVLLVVGWKDPDPENGQQRVLADDLDVREIDAPYALGKVKARALLIARAAERAMEGVWPDGCENGEQWGCAFWQLHEGDGAGFMELTDAKKVAEVEVRAAQIAVLEGTVRAGKGAEEKVKALKKEVAGIVGSGFKGRAGGWKVSATVSQVEESVRTVKAHERTTVKIEKWEDA
jgi:hypothetical protein